MGKLSKVLIGVGSFLMVPATAGLALSTTPGNTFEQWGIAAIEFAACFSVLAAGLLRRNDEKHKAKVLA